MMESKRNLVIIVVYLVFIGVVASTQFPAFAWTDVPVVDDPLVRMPGTQPGDVNLDDSGQCSNCHENYDPTVEPTHNWRGSMMAQSARDFLYLATMTVAAQDAIWAIGNPNATDLCIRCHFPVGWVNGRSDPTNASLMEKGDFDGVQCTVCHYMLDPFFEETYAGTREGNDWSGYWDENGTVSGTAADTALAADQVFSGNFSMYNGAPFFVSYTPPITYTENGSGQFFIGDSDNRRGPLADTDTTHNWYYSRYHKSKYFCSTCHDISNPVLANMGANPANPLPTETQPAYSYFHVERTFSEFMLSDYGQQDGADGIGPFAPGVFNTSKPGNVIATCQDCHMRDVTGDAANNTGITRPTDSTEHPNSGVSLHDLTGGSVWVPNILASTDSGSTNYDPTNDLLLNDRLSELTLDLSTNQTIGFDDPDAIIDGANRSLQMLQMAAVITETLYSPYSGNLRFVVQNQTGHKLISGYPEGRRMFVNIKYYDDVGSLIYEVNPYDETAGTLKGLSYPYTTTLNLPADLTSAETYVDELVYEMHGSSSITGEDETFHFVLSDGRYKDNRIPPKGFDIAGAAARLSEPVWHGESAPDYFTAEEYEGGYDRVSMLDYDILVTGAVTVEVTLNYQTTSREYIEFLRNEINGSGELTLSGDGVGGDPAYLIQSDSFFTGLRAWGDTIWSLWLHNMNAPGAAPIAMASGEAYPSSPAFFDYGIEAGEVGTLNWTTISVPLSTSVSTADDLAAYIDSTNNSITRVARWDSATQSLIIRNVGSPFGIPNFNVNLGDWLMVAANENAPASFSWTGDVPAQGALQYSLVANGWTGIMLPLDQGDIATADDLGNAIGTVTRVARWDRSTQSLVIRNVGSAFGIPNFNIDIGYPYLVYSTSATTWP